MWMVRRQYRAALVWQVALAAYMQLISWIPLGRWNYQPCCPAGLELLRTGQLSVGDAFATGAFVLPAAVFWMGARWEKPSAMWPAVIGTAVWLGLQLWTWWPPYLFGASDRWSEVYARAFAQSTAVLPRWGDHLPPDAMHLVLQVFLTGSVISGTRAVRRAQHRTRPDTPHTMTVGRDGK